jgi:hypothetical protein
MSVNVCSIYRQLLRAVRKFPKEKILELSKDVMPFPQAASMQIRQEFKTNMAADPTAAAKGLASAQKELKALHSLLANDFLTQYPGPNAVEKLNKD